MPKRFTLPDELWSSFVAAAVVNERLSPSLTDEQRDAAAVVALRTLVADYIGRAAKRTAMASAAEAIRTTTVVETVAEE